jgi:hypothetical protein
VGDTTAEYARALLNAVGAGDSHPRIALAHATAYTDDLQVMAYLARRLDALGARTALVSPAHLRWRDGRAHLATDWGGGPVDLVVRFFPGQSKRFPLVWDDLRTPLPTWRALLPETRDPRDAPWRTGEEWVLKPALGRVGDGVGIAGVTEAKEWRRITRDARLFPRHWVAQRRFRPTPLAGAGTAGGAAGDLGYPCIGVYTIGARAAGAYGRLARRPLVDWMAQDVAVLVGDSALSVSPVPCSSSPGTRNKAQGTRTAERQTAMRAP